MRKLFRPKVLIPLILSVSVVAVLLAFGDVRKVLALLLGFQWQYLVSFMLLMLAYEVVRVAQWHFVLKALDIRVPLRTQIFTFLAGEVAKTLPIGNYFPSYLLSQSKGTKLGVTSAAATLIIFIEVTVSLLGVIILGIGDWTWLRPLIVLGMLAAVAGGWLVLHVYNDKRPPRWMLQRASLRKALRGLHDFREGARELMRPRVLLVQTACGAVYLILAGLALYMVLLGLGIPHVTVWQALSVYFFSLSIGLIVPIPIDIGLIEFSGIGALLAFGVTRSDAVGAMLLNRVLSLGASLVISLIAVAVLRSELRAALSDHSAPREEEHDDADEPTAPVEPQHAHHAAQQAAAEARAERERRRLTSRGAA